MRPPGPDQPDHLGTVRGDEVEAVGRGGHLDERRHPQPSTVRGGEVLEDPRDRGQGGLVADQQHLAGLGGKGEGPTAGVALEPPVRSDEHRLVADLGPGRPVPRRAGVVVNDHVDVHGRTRQRYA